MKAKKWIAMTMAFAAAASLAGCTVRKELGGNDSEVRSAKVFEVEQGTVDLGGITEVMLGMTAAEAYEYSCQNSYYADGIELTVNNKGQGSIPIDMAAEDEQILLITYQDFNNGAWGCYSKTIWDDINDGLSDGKLRDIFPEEDLKACSKEEAIEACRPYAEACGYQNADISVYAVTLDLLLKNAEIDHSLDGTVNGYSSAPGPGYEVISRKEIIELRESLNELREKGEPDEEGEKQAELMNWYYHTGGSDRGIPWEEKHEVLILTYQSYLNGYPTYEDFYCLRMVYSPLYGRPVFLQGWVPNIITKELEEEELISVETAISSVRMIKGISEEEELEIESKLVYAPQCIIDELGGSSTDKVIPCWQIDYIRRGKWNRVLIDARFGDEYNEFGQY